MNNHNLFHEIIVKGLRNNNHFILNPLHPNISMYILHTVLYIFPNVLTRRICLAIKSFFSWWSFCLFLWP